MNSWHSETDGSTIQLLEDIIQNDIFTAIIRKTPAVVAVILNGQPVKSGIHG